MVTFILHFFGHIKQIKAGNYPNLFQVEHRLLIHANDPTALLKPTSSGPVRQSDKQTSEKKVSF